MPQSTPSTPTPPTPNASKKAATASPPGPRTETTARDLQAERNTELVSDNSPEADDVLENEESVESLVVPAAKTAPDGSALITVSDTRTAAFVIKAGKSIAQIGGYTAATLEELEKVVGKLHKRGLLDSEAAELYEAGDEE